MGCIMRGDVAAAAATATAKANVNAKANMNAKTCRAVLLCAIAFAVVASSAHVARAVDLSVLDGEYDENDTLIIVSAQTALCTDELWLDSSKNGDNDAVLNASAIVFEDGDDPCSGAVFEMSDTSEINEVFTLDYPPDYSVTLRIRAGQARYGFMPLNDTLLCGKRQLRAFRGIPAAFVWLESGFLSVEESIAGTSKSYDLDTPTVMMIGEMVLLNETRAAVPQGCVYSYDEPLPDDSVCFPSSAKVAVPCAYEQREDDVCWKSMDDLELGEEVFVDAQMKERSTLFWFGHREPQRSAHYVRIDTVAGRSLRLSPEHLIYVEDGSRVSASSVNVGDVLAAARGENGEVTAVRMERARGVFNPHTLRGAMVVDGALVSCYTALVPPAVAHLALLPLRLAFVICGARNVQALAIWRALHGAAPKWLVAVARQLFQRNSLV